MKINFKNKRGMSLLKMVIIGFILILVLGYFGISIKTVIENPTNTENIGYVKGSALVVWNNYLKKPLTYIWNDLLIDIFWKSFINNMERIRDGKPTDYETAAPLLPNNVIKP